MKLLKILPLTLMAFMFIVTDAIAMALANSWQDTTLNKQQCLNRAEIALRNMGFSQNFQVADPAVFGDKDQYSAAIQCITEKGAITFLIAGPDGKMADSLLTKLEKSF